MGKIKMDKNKYKLKHQTVATNPYRGACPPKADTPLAYIFTDSW